jgi:hypothetical protein
MAEFLSLQKSHQFLKLQLIDQKIVVRDIFSMATLLRFQNELKFQDQIKLFFDHQESDKIGRDENTILFLWDLLVEKVSHHCC